MAYRFQIALKVGVAATGFIRHALLCLFLLLPFMARAVEPGNLISPGHCVGKICLDATRGALRQILGRPAFSKDIPEKYAADTWKSRKGELLIVVYVKETVTDIHVTSPSFSTSEGISTSSTFDEVKRNFPMGREDEYAIFENGHNRTDWIAASQGITFTFAGDLTGAILRIAIHKRNATKTVGYSQGELWYWTERQH